MFDFADGVTAIVGPNGCGKSNIVDAVRWILGEQSAKSLRGGEMADVIFNGSAIAPQPRPGRSHHDLRQQPPPTGHRRRRSADHAAASIAPAKANISSTSQLCRLKDIKDMFLGTGAGSDAYCIIEQGRVDGLLQASTKDRRTIFEEAAGISRFKARKIETLRKLEKVDQNLQRLRDIIDEVEKQLRSVKLQASKAQRYQEYSQQAPGAARRRQPAAIPRAERAIADRAGSGRTASAANLAERSAETQAGEAEMQRLDAALAGLEEAVREQEVAPCPGAAANRHRGDRHSTASATLSADLETDLARSRAGLTELNAKVAILAETAAAAGKDCAAVEAQCQEQRQRAQSLETDLRAATDRLAALQQQVQADKIEHLEQMRQAAHLQNDAVSFKAQVDNLRREHERLRLRGARRRNIWRPSTWNSRN